ncbi:MAG: 4Fe-4S dicluster domain-containing protein [Ruminococcaceae bacterium]|nr:4Fe-4S dicluster domain-containing protein [Oscillospiraceae bacterium]
MAKVSFFEDKCKGCELCVTVCPKKIIKMERNKLNAKGYNPANVSQEDMVNCIGCAMCARMCPDCVIVVEK